MINVIIGISIFMVGVMIGTYLIGSMFSSTRSAHFDGIITTTPRGKLQDSYGGNPMLEIKDNEELTEYGDNEKLADETIEVF